MADSLVAKLARIMGKIDRIPKNGWNDFHKYNYATEADVAEHCRKFMAEEKIVLIPNIKEVVQLERDKGGNKVSDVTRLKIEFTFMDGESDAKISFMVVGDAQDAVDKGIYKAFTGAQKYALMKSFMIPTGDDPEADGEKGKDKNKKPAPPSPPPTVPQEPHEQSTPANPMTRSNILKVKEWPSKKPGGNPSYQITARLDGNEQWFTTWKKDIYDLVKDETESGMEFDIEYVKKDVGGKIYHNIVSLKRVDEPGADENAQ